MFGKLMKNPLLLVAVAAGAYFLFFRKTTPTVPAVAPSAAGPTATAATPDPFAKVLDAGAGLLSEAIKYGAGEAKEALAGDGMAPATLNGMVASVGGLGDLGGSFYGSW